MFDTVAMSRLTVAAPVGRMADVLRACTELGCVHIESYTNFEDGVNVGQASSSEEANRVSSLLAKVRAAISAFKPVNADGPVPLGRVKELLEGSFADELQSGLDLLDTHRDSEAELEVLDEQIHLLRRLAPLKMDLELLAGSARVEVYVAETKKASKAKSVFGSLTQKVELAVSGQAFALDAWVPSSKSDEVKTALRELASHVDVEAFEPDHHHHDDHDDHHDEPTPPVALENDAVSRPFELMVGLVGRPTYGTFDPTFFLMLTFPMIYGLILGDFGYGFIIFLLGTWLGTMPFAADPVAKNGITILKWMGVWCMIWGFLFAEGFGFVWDDTGQMGDASPLAGIYAWTYSNITFPAFVTDTLNMSYTHIPFHRATSSLSEYVLLSVYLGVAHLMFGFILGFINVARAHGVVAAFFEKGSWMIILAAGTLHIYGFLTSDQGVFDATPYAIATLVGVVCLIIGLAVFEKFGWAGGLIMGPIETFGLLANTLSYLRVMGVGVAGVKIAEVSITMGWDLMWSGGGVVSIVLGLVLFVLIQAFALALGLLSPSIHAARLHFVEWMGKFYDGSGRVFTPLGGRTLHTEGQS